MQGVEGMSNHLLGALTNARTTPAEAQDPIRYLLQLQTDGAASLRGQNPVTLYLDTQACRSLAARRVSRPCMQPGACNKLLRRGICVLRLQVRRCRVQEQIRVNN